ncbi:MAG: hypothetical protein ACTS8U_01725 [Arsenophonus sp. ET-DL9-MAG3]
MMCLHQRSRKANGLPIKAGPHIKQLILLWLMWYLHNMPTSHDGKIE